MNIRTYPDPVLKERAAAVEVIDDRIRRILEDMAETMYAGRGVGLAAPQVGLPLRLVVVDPGEPAEEDASAGLEPCSPGPSPVQSRLLKLVNPEILEGEGTLVWDEGCLSLPGISGEVERRGRVRVRALTPEGEGVEIRAEGLMAVVLQHEIDHLDGILFVDRMSRLRRRTLLREYEKARKDATA